MPQFVMMPVKALNEKCVKCPRLDIDVDRTHIYSDEFSQMENHIFCKNCDQCTYSYNMGLEDGAKATEKTAKITDENELDMNNPWFKDIVDGMDRDGKELVEYLIQKIADGSGLFAGFVSSISDTYQAMSIEEKWVIERLVAKIEENCHK